MLFFAFYSCVFASVFEPLLDLFSQARPPPAFITMDLAAMRKAVKKKAVKKAAAPAAPAPAARGVYVAISFGASDLAEDTEEEDEEEDKKEKSGKKDKAEKRDGDCPSGTKGLADEEGAEGQGHGDMSPKLVPLAARGSVKLYAPFWV